MIIKRRIIQAIASYKKSLLGSKVWLLTLECGHLAERERSLFLPSPPDKIKCQVCTEKCYGQET